MDFVASKVSPCNLYQYIGKCPYLSHTHFVLKYDRAILLIYLNLTIILTPMWKNKTPCKLDYILHK